MKTDEEVEKILTIAADKIIEVCNNYDVNLTYFEKCDVYLQYIQKHQNGDESIRELLLETVS